MDVGKLLSDGVVGGLVVIVYYLVKLLGPLVKRALSKPGNGATLTPQALVIDLQKYTTRVESLERLIDERSAALDNKMEAVLVEMKEMREDSDGRHTDNRKDLGVLTAAFNEAYRLMTERLVRVEQNQANLEKMVEREIARRSRP